MFPAMNMLTPKIKGQLEQEAIQPRIYGAGGQQTQADQDEWNQLMRQQQQNVVRANMAAQAAPWISMSENDLLTPRGRAMQAQLHGQVADQRTGLLNRMAAEDAQKAAQAAQEQGATARQERDISSRRELAQMEQQGQADTGRRRSREAFALQYMEKFGRLPDERTFADFEARMGGGAGDDNLYKPNTGQPQAPNTRQLAESMLAGWRTEKGGLDVNKMLQSFGQNELPSGELLTSLVDVLGPAATPELFSNLQSNLLNTYRKAGAVPGEYGGLKYGSSSSLATGLGGPVPFLPSPYVMNQYSIQGPNVNHTVGSREGLGNYVWDEMDSALRDRDHQRRILEAGSSLLRMLKQAQSGQR